MTIRLFVLLNISAMAVIAGVPVTRTIDVSATIKPIALEAYAGETLDLSVQLASGGAALATPSASATIYWQTNGMAGAWWQTNLACSATGFVSGQWMPSLPSGRVWFFVGVESSGLNYRIAGQCAILPSPGGAPSTAVLPPPGGTLNLGDYTVIGAPWITSADSAAAIASATDPIAADVAALAASQQSASNSLATALQSTSNHLAGAVQQVAQNLTSASNALAQSSAALSVEMAELRSATATQISTTSNALAGSVSAAAAAATNYTDAVASEINARLDSIDIPDISGLATQSALQSASNDLAQAISATASNALAQSSAALSVEMAELGSATATQISTTSNALAQVIFDNAQQAAQDLASASNALAQSSAALSAEMAELGSATATQISTTSNALAGSVSAAAAAGTNYTAEVAAQTESAIGDLAERVNNLSLAASASNTAFRLANPEDTVYLDATGIVWHVAYATNLSPWFVSGISYTNGTAVATNGIPGVSSWSISGPYEVSEGSGDYYYNLHIPANGNVYAQNNNTFDEQPLTLQFDIGTDVATANFTRTNIVTRYWTPADQVLYASSGGGSASGITTNDVCNIITNNIDVNTFSEWTISSSAQLPIYLIFYDGQWRPVDIQGNPEALVGDPKGDANSTNLVWASGSDSAYDITATRTVTSSYGKNSLGIAGETGAVSEILMIGSDNKLYHLRIGSGGSIDVYMEAN